MYCTIWPNLNVSFYLWRLIKEINLHWPLCVYSVITYREKYQWLCLCWLVFTVKGRNLFALRNKYQWKGRVVDVCENVCENVFKNEAGGVLKQNWPIWRYFVCLCASVCVHTCVLKVYIHSCLCWVDCFITLMKRSYTGCQMCSPVSMSPCPRLRFFHQKRKWKHTLLAWGRERLRRLLKEVRKRKEREEGEHEDVHIWICSKGTFTESNGGGSFWICWLEELGREVTACRKTLKRDACCAIWNMKQTPLRIGFCFLY